MLITIKKQTASHPVAISCLVGVIVMGLAQSAGAFASADSSENLNKETCAFSLQLQKSVSVRRQYLVRVDEVLGRSSTASNAVEDMYGNIQPASYSPGDDAAETTQTGTVSFSFGKKTAKSLVSLDSFSADCLSCHDGVGASSVGVDLRNNPVGRRSRVNSFSSDHPIGMSYDYYVAVDRGFKPVPGNTKMIFANGKVGCLTCHDPLNPEKGHLVMSDRESALCKTCHNK